MRLKVAPTSGAGFTVIELAIVMAVAMSMMASLMGLLASQSNAAARTERFANNQEDVRLVLVALQRDLRSAETIVAAPDGTDPSFQVDLTVYPSPTATSPETIRWRITPARELVRETVGSQGDAVVSYALPGVSNLTSGVPLLAYYGPASTVSYASATGDPSRVIAECTVRVRIDVRAAPRPGPAPVHLVSDVQLRNRIAGVDGC